MMHRLISSCLKLRVLIAFCAVVLLIQGYVEVRKTPLDVIPEFSPPKLRVSTEALGLSTAEVESLITVPMEADLLNGVPWLRSIESDSITGLSSIEMFFAPGTDLVKARQLVQERLVQAHALPNVSSPPILMQPVSSLSRIMNVVLSSRKVSLMQMSVLARWTIVPRLVGVPGVANVSVYGLRNRQIQVLVDPAKLNGKGVTLEQIVKTAGESVWASPLTFLNSSTPGSGGFIDTPNQRLGVRHISPTVSAESFAKVPVFGTKFALGDVAKVVEDSQPLIGDALGKDGSGLMLVIEKFPGANTGEVTRNVEAALAELAPGMRDIEVDTTSYRPAGFIDRATQNLSVALVAAYLLAIVAVFFLLGSWRAALVAALAMPLPLIVAAYVMHLRGVGLNMMVAAGCMLAISVIVDDIIGDIQNVLRRLRQEGEKDSAARSATIVRAVIEMRGPIAFAAVIIVLATLPVLFLQGPSADFFAPLILTYIIAVAASIAVAMFVTPPVAALLLAGGRGGEFRENGAGIGLVSRLQQAYENLAAYVRGPMPTYVLAAVAVVAGYLLWTQTERSLVPSFKETDVLVEWNGEHGMSLPAMQRSTNDLMGELRSIPGVRNVAAHIGRAVLSDEAADVNSAKIWVSLDPKADYAGTLAAMREKVKGHEGMEGDITTFLSKRLREALTGGEDHITVRVYGHDLKIVADKAREIRDLLGKIEGVEDASVELPADKTTIEVKADLDKARQYGLKPGDVRRAASTLMAGITVGALFEDQKVYDVVVWGDTPLRANIDTLRNLMIDVETPKGSQVRLGDVAEVKTVSAPGVIQRHGVSRFIDVDADVHGRDLAQVSREVSRRIKDVSFPFEYHARVTGEHFARRDAIKPLRGYLVAAMVIAYFVLQAALGSWRLSLLSFLSIPIVFLGSLLAAFVTGGVFSLGTLLGLIAVLALTARNGITLVRHFQQLELVESVPFGETLVARGVRERFAPIITSALTVLIFFLPLVAMGNIAGLEIAHPMAVSIFGGMVMSLLTTLMAVPALYLRFGAGTANANVLDQQPLAVPTH